MKWEGIIVWEYGDGAECVIVIFLNYVRTQPSNNF